MDEKVAEVANLTLRLREMSGQVMWHETQQVPPLSKMVWRHLCPPHTKVQYSV